MVQKGRTVNLISTDSRQVQGRTVAPTTLPASRNLHPFRLESAVKPLERAAYPSRVARFYEGRMDEWYEVPATHSCLHTPPPPPPPLLTHRFPPSLAEFSSTTRLPKDEQIITPR